MPVGLRWDEALTFFGFMAKLDWERAKHVFDLALSIPLGEREGFVRSVCDGDRELEAEILGMLASSEDEDNFVRTRSDPPELETTDGAERLARLRDALASRYRVERMIAEGGMATVYLAEDVKLAREVALKVLKPELAAVVGADRFLREITTTARLQHPHILPLHESGDAEGLLYYVMPYVEGESLRIRMRRERPMGIGDAVRMTITIAEALDYAHRQGVVHRDIKPANILLQDGSPIIADFGVAVALDTQDRTRLTRSGILLGSPRYMSPEQLEDARNAAPSSDVYSLACVLHEMIAGEPVFDAGSHPGLAWQHLTQDPPPLRSIRPETPAWLERLVLHALAKAPEARPGSAALLAETLSAGAPTSGSLWRRLGRAAKGLFEGPGSG